MKVYVEIDRGGIVETRGAEVEDAEEAQKTVDFYVRQYGNVLRVLDERGVDVTHEYVRGDR